VISGTSRQAIDRLVKSTGRRQRAGIAETARQIGGIPGQIVGQLAEGSAVERNISHRAAISFSLQRYQQNLANRSLSPDG
jgi:hypothetical protein